MEADWATLPVPDLDSLQPPPPSAADPVESMQQQMAAVEHAVEGTLQERFLDASIALIELWQAVTDKKQNPQSKADREALRDHLHAVGQRTAKAVSRLIGDKQSTYLHAMCYNWPHVASMIGSILRISMEGFEHANKVWGEIWAHQVSKGGRKSKSTGVRKHEYVQALEHRRSGTAAMHALGKVNHTAGVKKYTMPEVLHEKVYDCKAQLAKLYALKAELEREVDSVENKK